MRRTAATLLAVALGAALLLSGCGGSPSSTKFCATSATLTSAGTVIQRLSPSDVSQVKAKVATLVPAAQKAESEAPKAISDDVKVLEGALEQFAQAVAAATDTQSLITAFSAYNQRAQALATQARHVDTWVKAHCQLAPTSATSVAPAT